MPMEVNRLPMRTATTHENRPFHGVDRNKRNCSNNPDSEFSKIIESFEN